MTWTAQWLIEFRRYHRLSLAQVAIWLGVSRQMVHQVERGARPLPVRWGERLERMRARYASDG